MSRLDSIDNKWPERLESDPAGDEERCGNGGGLGRNVGLIWEWISRGNVARTQLVKGTGAGRPGLMSATLYRSFGTSQNRNSGV